MIVQKTIINIIQILYKRYDFLNDQSRPIGIDVFCGAGGMSLGFEQAGFDVKAALDMNPIHVSTYENNFPKSVGICVDINLVTGVEIKRKAKILNREIGVLFGGPPCGGFSNIGKRVFTDPRNQLIFQFARLVKEIKPKYFIVENVTGLLIPPMNDIAEKFIQSIEEIGYSIVRPIKILDASDFGVPQKRKRVFIIGYQNGSARPNYPHNTLVTNGGAKAPTVWDAIGDLPDIETIEYLKKSDVYFGKLNPTDSMYAKILRGEVKDQNDLSLHRIGFSRGLTGFSRTNHKKETIDRFSKTEPGTLEKTSRLYRLSTNGISPTLRAGTDQSRGSYSAPRPIHPIANRCISVREGARLHSFPDWFEFHETKWHGFRQIGNSVPPFLARAVASSIIESLKS